LAEPHAVLNALVALSDATGRIAVLPEPAGTVLAGHALIALLVASITDAGRSETVPDAALRRGLEIALATGSPDDEHVLEVLARADEVMRHQIALLQRAYSEAGASHVDFEPPSLRDSVSQSPAWIDRYMDLVQRLRANPSAAHTLLQTAELACFDAILGGNAWRAEAFDHLFTPEHRNLLRAAAATVSEIGGRALGDRLDALSKLPFDRSPPAVPDRRRPHGEERVLGEARLAVSEDPPGN
jgi:hypothetical protein